MENSKYVIPSVSESDFSTKVHQQYRQKIQGIEKVYVPYYEFCVLATFSDGQSPFRRTYHCDAILLDVTMLDDDYTEPKLVDRSSGTLFPVAYEPFEARGRLQKHVTDFLLKRCSGAESSFNLSVEYNGKFYFPFWIAYFQGSRSDIFEMMVFDAYRGTTSDIGKDIVDKGFILLDEARANMPPWF